MGLSLESNYHEFESAGNDVFENPYSRDLAQATTLLKLNLVGWWSECLPPYPNLNAYSRCAGNFTPVEPIPLDPTGNTCYVNPLSGFNAIQWMGGLPDENGTLSDEVYIYNVVPNLLTYRDYMPLDCTTGTCSCDSIESLRSGWNLPNATIPSWCKPNVICTIVPFNPDPNNCTLWGGLRYVDGSLGTNVSVNICYLLADIQQQPRVPIFPPSFTSSTQRHGPSWRNVMAVAILILGSVLI
jgi:hypothetical protein